MPADLELIGIIRYNRQLLYILLLILFLSKYGTLMILTFLLLIRESGAYIMKTRMETRLHIYSLARHAQCIEQACVCLEDLPSFLLSLWM